MCSIAGRKERNIKEDQSPSARYVNRDTVGYSDLDDYGTWKEEPEVGNVWVPNNVSPGWAPYSDGNWGLCRTLGLDVGWVRALGFCALSLWPLE